MIIEYLTAILVFVTAIYVYLTYKMAQASEESVRAVKEQSNAMLRPYLIFEPYIRPNTPFLYLRIKNTGKTAARKLSIKLDRDFYQFGEKDKNLKDAVAFNTVMDSFAPNSELLFGLGQGWVIFGKDAEQSVTPSQFTITATYSFADTSVTERNNIDLRAFVGSEGEKDPLIEELENVRKEISKLSKA